MTKWIPRRSSGAINPRRGSRTSSRWPRRTRTSGTARREVELRHARRSRDQPARRRHGQGDRRRAGAVPGRENVAEFAQRELFDPLGMKAANWPGEEIGGTMNRRVRDMARMGELILQRGRYNGRQLARRGLRLQDDAPRVRGRQHGLRLPDLHQRRRNWGYSTGTNDTTARRTRSGRRTPTGRSSRRRTPTAASPASEQKHDIGVVCRVRRRRAEVHHLPRARHGHRRPRRRGERQRVRDRRRPFAGREERSGTRSARRCSSYDPVYKDDEAAFCAAYRRSDYAPALREPWFKESPAPRSPGEQPVGQLADPSAPRTAACVSRRRLTIGIRARAACSIRRVTVTVDGRRVRVRRGKRMTATVDLRGAGPGPPSCASASTGRGAAGAATSRQTRAFRTCFGGRSAR